MQVFKLYFKLLKSVANALIIYACIFSALVIIMSSSKSNNVTFYEESKVATAIVNYNEDNYFVKNFTKYLENFCEFKDLGDDEMVLADALFFREVSYIITIPYNFGEEFLSGKDVLIEKKTVPDGVYSATVDQAINNYLNTARTYINTVPDISEEDLIYNIQTDLDSKSKVVIEKQESSKSDYSYYNGYFNSSAFLILTSCILGVGMIMLSFHNINMRRRITVTPMSHKEMNFQLIAGNLIFVFGYVILFILISYILNPLKTIDGNVLLFWLNFAVFAISALSISYLIATLVKKKEVNDIISNVLPLGLCFISGAFVPQILLGKSVLKLAEFTPVYWYIKGNDTIAGLTTLNITSTKNVFYSMLIQIGFAAAFFSLSLMVSKNNSRKDN